MSTIVRLVDGGQLTVAGEPQAVIDAVIRFHPKPVPLETAAGETLFLNWDHVAFVRGETPH
jgi:hypothetical protein